MGVARRAPPTCDLTELFRLLGAPYVLDVLHVLLVKNGPLRFKDIQIALGMSPNTLTGRLKDLVQAGLLTREAFHEIPPRVEYTPSPKALELMPLFDTLAAWSQRNNLRAAVPAT